MSYKGIERVKENQKDGEALRVKQLGFIITPGAEKVEGRSGFQDLKRAVEHSWVSISGRGHC